MPQPPVSGAPGSDEDPGASGGLPRLLFTPEQCQSYGRCDRCGWHPPTQGHHGACPNSEEVSA